MFAAASNRLNRRHAACNSRQTEAVLRRSHCAYRLSACISARWRMRGRAEPKATSEQTKHVPEFLSGCDPIATIVDRDSDGVLISVRVGQSLLRRFTSDRLVVQHERLHLPMPCSVFAHTANQTLAPLYVEYLLTTNDRRSAAHPTQRNKSPTAKAPRASEVQRRKNAAMATQDTRRISHDALLTVLHCALTMDDGVQI